MVAALIILILLAVLAAVLLFRAARLKQPPIQVLESSEEKVDAEKAVRDLQALIRCKTVSYREKELEDDAAFQQLYGLLPGMFPRVHQVCECFRPNDRSLLFRWPGNSSERPSVFMAHYDVVPVNENDWQRPAFEALIENGEMWGRGTLDTKTTFLSVLEAAENLMAEGFTPARDIYLAFGGDEEISGGGAPAIVAWLKDHGVQPDFVLDEGGAVVENVFPGVKAPCAVVGISEKGPMDVKLRLKTAGGHASTPPAHTPVGVLAKAVKNIEDHPFPFTLTAPAEKMFKTLCGHSSLLYRVIFANLWCFRPVLNLLCKKSGGEMNALVRTTVAFTQMQGGAASNVLPPDAWVGANLRLIPGETMESACARLKKLSGDDRIEVEVVHGMNPSPISETDGEPWQRLEQAIRLNWPEAIVSPYLMLACSDSRHYGPVSKHVYRFSAMALSKEQRGMIHGNNERIPLDTIVRCVQFYQTILRMS